MTRESSITQSGVLSALWSLSPSQLQYRDQACRPYPYRCCWNQQRLWAHVGGLFCRPEAPARPPNQPSPNPSTTISKHPSKDSGRSTMSASWAHVQIVYIVLYRSIGCAGRNCPFPATFCLFSRWMYVGSCECVRAAGPPNHDKDTGSALR